MLQPAGGVVIEQHVALRCRIVEPETFPGFVAFGIVGEDFLGQRCADMYDPAFAIALRERAVPGGVGLRLRAGGIVVAGGFDGGDTIDGRMFDTDLAVAVIVGIPAHLSCSVFMLEQPATQVVIGITDIALGVGDAIGETVNVVAELGGIAVSVGAGFAIAAGVIGMS